MEVFTPKLNRSTFSGEGNCEFVFIFWVKELVWFCRVLHLTTNAKLSKIELDMMHRLTLEDCNNAIYFIVPTKQTQNILKLIIAL